MRNVDDRPIVVPVVIFLDNGQQSVGSDGSSQRLASEPVLPLTIDRKALSSVSAHLRRIKERVDDPLAFCPVADVVVKTECSGAVSIFQKRVIHVDRSIKPEVSSPLGWVLSDTTMDALDEAMDCQVGTAQCVSRRGQLTDQTGQVIDFELNEYGRLEDLFRYLRREHALKE